MVGQGRIELPTPGFPTRDIETIFSKEKVSMVERKSAATFFLISSEPWP